MASEKKYIEIVWHGRGGQGAITASRLIANAAHYEGYKGITTAPSFGAERRGAPVSAFLRLAQEPLRIFSQINDPDVIVVLDPTLLSILDLERIYSTNSTLIINSTETPEKLNVSGFKKIGIADITSVALENNLTMAGVAILNTPILGAFVKTTELVSMQSVEWSIEQKFSAENAVKNIHTAKQIYESTKIYIK